MAVNYGRLVHGIKTALACGLGLYLTKAIELPIDQWLIITILVVMCAQPSVGGMLQKSYMRFLGTLSGSLIAALTLLIFGYSPLVFGIILVLSALGFSYLATSPSRFNDAGTLGVITVAIILITKNPTLEMAIIRFVEISTGIVIAFLISRFIFPLSARKYLKQDIADNLQRLQQAFTGVLTADEAIKIPDLEDSIINSFVNQRKLIKEADREALLSTFDSKVFNEIVVCEREILRGIDFLHYALQLSDRGKNYLAKFIPLTNFIMQVQKSFNAVSYALQEQTIIKQEKIDLQWTEEILPLLLHSEELTVNDIQHLSLLLFCMRTISIRLHELSFATNRVINGEPHYAAGATK